MESNGEVKMKKILSLLTIISEVRERDRPGNILLKCFIGAKLGMQKKP